MEAAEKDSKTLQESKDSRSPGPKNNQMDPVIDVGKLTTIPLNVVS